MKRVANRWAETPAFTQGVFGGVFLIGTAGVLLMKGLGAPQAVVTAWPLLLMAAYASLVFIPPFRLRPDQTGDNLYYLGFLFTLVSLGYSLFQFSVSAGVDEIVQNFGIAIASTIAGVFGRVLLNQMRTDPWEMERSARLALVESARNLRNELDNSVIEFNAYRRQVQQAAADGIRELQGIATEQLSGATDRLEKMVQETTGRVEAVVAQWSDTASGFSARSAEMADAMSTLGRRLEAVRAPAEIIEEKIAPAGEAVTRLAAAAEGAAASIQGAAGRIETGAEELKGIVEGSREVLEVARANSRSLSEAGAVLEAARSQVERLAQAGQTVEGNISRAADDLAGGLGKFLERLEGQLASAQALAERGERAVADGAAAEIARLGVEVDRLAALAPLAAEAVQGRPTDPGLVAGHLETPRR